MSQATDPYVEFLRVRRGCTIYLKPYSGNSGDELIWMGSDLLLRELGLKRVLNPALAEIILMPGGNPSMWGGHFAEWQDCWTCWPGAEFVVGPAGFQGSILPWREMIKASAAKISGLFARDLKSFENLRQLDLPPATTIGLGDDPAFHLRDSPWIAELREAGSSEYILAAFRADCESAMPVADAIDGFKIWPLRSVCFRYRHHMRMRFHRDRLKTVMKLADSGLPLVEQDVSLMNFQKFVESINRSSQVHTDRLHCMILAVLLGKKVFAYSTAYQKLEGIYEKSIQSWAKVDFVNQSPRI